MRSRTDDELSQILRARPDLTIPTPADSTTLAARIADRYGVARALDDLDAVSLAVLDALLLMSPDVTEQELGAALGVDVSGPLAGLRARALVWDTPALRAVSGVGTAIERPGGLGRPLAVLLRRLERASTLRLLQVHGLPGAQEIDESAARLVPALRAAYESLDAQEHEVLAAVDEAGGLGAVSRAFDVASPDDPSPVRRLLAAGLLVPIDIETVELPRELGLLLRGNHPVPRIATDPPPLTGAALPRPDLDAAGALAAADVVRLVTLVLDGWGQSPPAELKSGGLGQRDLKAASRRLDTTEEHTALAIEVARSAGLIGRTTAFDGRFAPTAAYDAWTRLDTAAQWTALATGWLRAPIDVGLLGAKDERGRVRAALSPQPESPAVRELRAQVLTVLAGGAVGLAPTVESVLQRLTWLRPRRSRLWNDRAVARVLDQSDQLGLSVGGGALTGYARALLGGDAAACTAELSRAFPAPVDHLLLQADLTAIAPGPLVAGLAEDVALLADVESPGGATVFRFSERSLRRAMDMGWDAAGIRDLLGRIGRPEVPQALSYLVEDTARRYGKLRLGSASSYIRCDDEALLGTALTDRRNAALQLRRIAPTVAISGLRVAELLDGLRAAGYSPAAERADGAVVIGRPERIRAARSLPAAPSAERTLSDTDVTRIVASIRTGDIVATRTVASSPARHGVQATLALLDQAIGEGRPVVLGYINAQGQDSRRLVEPQGLSGGLLTAYDHKTQERRSFALHRITELDFADEGGA